MNCSSIIWQQSSVGTVWLWQWCVVRGKNVSASDCIKILPPLSQIWSAIYKLYSPAQEHAAYCQSSSSTHVTTNTTIDHIISDTISNIQYPIDISIRKTCLCTCDQKSGIHVRRWLSGVVVWPMWPSDHIHNIYHLRHSFYNSPCDNLCHLCDKTYPSSVASVTTLCNHSYPLTISTIHPLLEHIHSLPL